MTTLIQGGQVISSRGVRRADVLIEGETVANVGDLERFEAGRVLDASGCFVIPGAVDVHTHLDMEVGEVRSADDFLTGTRAAACGGTTTVIDFATAYRGESPAQGLARWHDKARGKAVVDYAFHMSLTELQRPADDIVAEMVEAGVTSFKLYMTYPDRLMVPDETIREVMAAAPKAGALVCLHCEDDATISRLRERALADGHTEPKWQARTRPPGAEAAAVRRAARMAEEEESACYVVHLSSAAGLAEVRTARERGVPLFAETCPQYLLLSEEALESAPEEAANFVCAPPLRDSWHQEELWEGLLRGALQVVSTDHCPFDVASRRAGVGGGGWANFSEIPGGLAGIETRLALVYQRVIDGEMSPEQWVDRCCTTPAKLFGLHPAKGEIAPGADADVVVFDPRAERRLLPENLHMATDHSPYSDVVVKGWPAVVLVRGREVARNGVPVGEAGWGRYIARGPSGVPA